MVFCIKILREKLPFDPWIEDCRDVSAEVVDLAAVVSGFLSHLIGSALEPIRVAMGIPAGADHLNDMVHEEKDQTYSW